MNQRLCAARVLALTLWWVCVSGCGDDRLGAGEGDVLDAFQTQRQAAVIDEDDADPLQPIPATPAVNGGVDILALADSLGITLQPALASPQTVASLTELPETRLRSSPTPAPRPPL
jgi:hypothetical protein